MTERQSEFKDYPQKLRLSCAAATLSQAIYYSYCESFGIPVEDWQDVPWNQRQGLLEVAHRTLKALEPAAQKTFSMLIYEFANLLAHESAAKVLSLVPARKAGERASS